jgi:hypothetical protein
VLLATTLAAQDLPDWVLNLSRAKRQAKANFAHLPNYACAETVGRFEKTAKDRDFRSMDTLRLEVAVVEGRELYAKAGGEFKFDRPIDVIASGAFATGSFSSVVNNLFRSDASRPTGWARETRDDRPAWRFDFEIPQTFAPWKLGVWSREATVGERGSFWVDAATFDLIEIEDHATDIPPDFPITAVQVNIRYSRTKIGASEVILPADATTLIESPTQRTRNVTRFSSCREYGADSKITFDETPPIPVKK